ncbi:3-oxoacyl-[acyl-carrier-protein] synthase 2 [Sulfurospirillum diekertiae]|uniref:3-oxoacyl-[acyl-carrier-protein] synthase 2 n=1 Tax=Sulfurospirillum diekertiae TaxID=1854492 RepID=A0A290HBE5_9BACT|nr:beta-ketoacyl-ACP synthase II [Sulfurospirillum diekertiae]ATB68777.1 3-oxoacyl-[acyl-carrier-protein] synthase 2 [Sulfurospirillum diekertiae]
MKRVVITGMDMITPLGYDMQTSFDNIIAGKSGITTISNFDASSLPVHFGGEIKAFDASAIMNPKDVKKTDRFIHLGIKTAMEAFKDAHFSEDGSIDFERFGIVGASAIGGLPRIEESAITLHEKGSSRISPFFIPASLVNLLGGHIAIILGLKGPNLSSSTACAASNHAISEACRIIMLEQADIMLVTGSESALCALGISGFASMKSLSTHNENPQTASRPFDKHRDGFVMGEGSATLVLEEYEHAIKRNAKIYAEIVGFAESCDANHITTPTIQGPLRSMQQAVKMAEKRDANFALDYINAHATSTPVGDKNETEAIKQLLAGKPIPPVSSTKGATGHCLGASGMIEAVITVLAMQESILPPTINYTETDLENQCDLDYVPNQARAQKIKYAMSNSFGFGGTNGTIIFKNLAV